MATFIVFTHDIVKIKPGNVWEEEENGLYQQVFFKYYDQFFTAILYLRLVNIIVDV